MNKENRIVTVPVRNLFSMRNVFTKVRAWLQSKMLTQRATPIPKPNENPDGMKLLFWYTSGSFPLRLLDYLIGNEFKKKKWRVGISNYFEEKRYHRKG